MKIGKVNITSVGDNSFFLFDYVNGTIGEAANGYVELSDSKIAIKQAGSLEIKSTKSKVVIEKVKRLRAHTKYDDYNVRSAGSIFNKGQYDEMVIEEVSSMKCQSGNSDFLIGKIYESLDVDLKKGDVVIQEIIPGFSNLNLYGENATFAVTTGDNCSFDLDASAEYAGVTYPKSMQVSFEKLSSAIHIVKGRISNGGKRGKIFARLVYGGLKINR